MQSRYVLLILQFEPILGVAFQRVGRSDAYAFSYDLEIESYVPLPKSDLHKRKELAQDVTLVDLDAAKARTQGTVYFTRIGQR